MPEAGWYEPEDEPGTERWWDGEQWTDERREPVGQVADAAEPDTRPWYRKKRVLIPAALLLLLIFTSGGDDPATDTEPVASDESASEAVEDEESEDESEPAPEDEPEAADEEEPDVAAAHESGCDFASETSVRATPSCVDPWPLTVDEAEIYCEPPSQALASTSSGVYGLNGMAMTHSPDLPPLEDVWLENPEIEGTRINIGPLTDIALSLCDG